MKRYAHSTLTFFLIIASIFLAWWFGASGAAETFIVFFSPVPWIAAFLAGMCFASLFTAAPATVALGTLAIEWSLWQTAFAGGLGALLGDLIILELLARLTRRKSRPIAGVVKPPRFVILSRLRSAMKKGPLKILLWITGAIIIASPLPDEAGLALLGVSKVPLLVFVPLSFVLNAIGIYVVGLIALSV